MVEIDKYGYCKECGGIYLDVKNKVLIEKAILQAAMAAYGIHISPCPTYCRCEEGLPPLELRPED